MFVDALFGGSNLFPERVYGGVLEFRRPSSLTSKAQSQRQLSNPAQLPAAVQLNMASGDDQYHPKDAVKAAINGTMITGAAGGLVSAIQNTLTKRNVSAWGVFTRTGGTIAVFGGPYSTRRSFGSSTDDHAAAVGGTYEFTRFASANLREKDDSLNTAIGGFLAGSVLGLRCG
jgi:hypothetical protein